MPHEKICCRLILVLLIFSSPHAAVSEDGGIITCNAPPVGEGQPASVTCNFGHDVSTLPNFYFTVERYPYDGNDPVEVLACHSTNNAMNCPTERDGYTFDRKIGTSLRLSITEASANNTGRYVCKLDSRNITRLQPEQCFFNLTDISSTAPTDLTNGTTPATGSPDNKFPIIIGVAVPLLVILAIAAVVIVIFIVRRRREPKSRPPDDKRTLEISYRSNHDQTLSETPANEEEKSDDTPAKPTTEQQNPDNPEAATNDTELTAEPTVTGTEGTDDAGKPLLAEAAEPEADPKV